MLYDGLPTLRKLTKKSKNASKENPIQELILPFSHHDGYTANPFP